MKLWKKDVPKSLVTLVLLLCYFDVGYGSDIPVFYNQSLSIEPICSNF